MGKVNDLIQKLKREAPRQEAAILDILAENENLMIDLNTGQLLEGKDSEGDFLRDYRNRQYALFKLRLNPKGVTDLNLTGKFHRSFVAITDRFPVLFSATDSKTEDLVNKYGANIFGLDQKSKAILSKTYLKDSIVDYYRRLFQL